MGFGTKQGISVISRRAWPAWFGARPADGGPGAPRRLSLAALSALTFLIAVVNSLSVGWDLRRRHIPAETWEPWCWELSSWIGLCAGFVVLVWLDDRIRRQSWGAVSKALAYAGMFPMFSVLHVATMVALRVLVYFSVGLRYDFGSPLGEGFYEVRKDAVTYMLALLAIGGLRLALRAAGGPEPSRPRTPPAFVVTGRGGATLVRAEDIYWVEAQGNYIALHCERQSYLVRKSLREAESTLKDWGFLRVHRSALVNALMVREIRSATGASDPSVELKNGQSAPLALARKALIVQALSRAP